MNESDVGRRLKATAVFAALGAGAVMLILSLSAVLALILGETIGLSEFLPPLLMAGAVGAVGGGLFAGGISVLGRQQGGDRLSYSAAMIAGASATFLAPLLLGLVLFFPHSIPILEVVLEYASGAWWLLGLGGAAGLVLNGVARRGAIGPGEQPEVITAGDPAAELGESP